jgi:hypothetical protein
MAADELRLLPPPEDDTPPVATAPDESGSHQPVAG